MSNQRQRTKKAAEPTALSDESTERLVIGYFLTNGDRFWDFVGKLKPEHFFTPRLGRIWAAILRCAGKNMKPKRELVAMFIRDDKDETTSIKVYLEIIMQEAEDNAAGIEIETDIQTILHLAGKRALLDALREAAVKVKSAELMTPMEELTSVSMAAILGANTGTSNRYMKTYAEVGHELMQEIGEDRQRGDEGMSRGLRPGLRAVEEVIGPLLPGKVYVLGGMSGVGKTAITKSITESASEDGKNKGLGWAYMASMEMTGREHAARSIAEQCGISSYKLERSELNQDEYERAIELGLRHMQRFPIMIDRTPFLTLEKMRANMLAVKNQRRLSMAVIDHLLLVRFNGRESMNDRVGESVVWAKIVAGELDIPIILLSQVNEKRIIERPSGMPIASDLFGGEVIQQNADVTAFIHRPEVVMRARGPKTGQNEADHEAALLAAKDRAVFFNLKGRGHGSGIKRELSFDGPTVSFRDI